MTIIDYSTLRRASEIYADDYNGPLFMNSQIWQKLLKCECVEDFIALENEMTSPAYRAFMLAIWEQ